MAIDPYHFTLNMPSNYMYMLPAVVDPSNLQQFCDRAVDGIAAIFLALKRRPVIRYQRTSDIAKRIAQETAVSNFSTTAIKLCYLTHQLIFICSTNRLLKLFDVITCIVSDLIAGFSDKFVL